MIRKIQYFGTILLILAFLLSACQSTPTATDVPATSEVSAQSDIVLNVAPARQSVTTFTYNFNPFSITYLFPTLAGIYEPLMINNRIAGELVPWLAESYEWSVGYVMV